MMDHRQLGARVAAAGLAWLVAFLAWPADHAQASLVRVTGVSLQETSDEIQVSIATSGQVRYQQQSVRLEWVVVDLLGAELRIPQGTLPESGGSISRIRISQFTPDAVRVVVEMTRPAHAHVAPTRDGTALIVRIPVGAGRDNPVSTPQRAPASDGALARVTGISVWGTPAKPWVTIAASGPIRYELRKVNPDWVVVDISKAQLALTSGNPPAGLGLVKQIRAGQFTTDTVRVVVELLEHVPVHIAASPDKAAIVVSFAAVAGRGLSRVPRAQGTDMIAPQPDRHPARGQAPSGTKPVEAENAAPAQAADGVQASVPRPAEPPTQGRAAVAIVAQPPVKDTYLLGPEDVLEVSVWGYPDMTRVVTVRPDGNVAVPLAGTVPASGRSVERLTQDLTRAFAKYIINPQVTVVVKEFRKIRVSVLGQVKKPGAYTLPPGTRVLDAVSAASGVTDNAALPQAQLVRATGTSQPLNLEDVLVQQDMKQNLVLEPGDTLIIPEDTTNKFYVLGDVNHPGMYPLKGDTTVLQALASAGGPVMHGTSSSTTAHIVRRVDRQQGPLTASARAQNEQPIANGNGVLITMDLRKMYQGDLRQDQSLRPGDVLVVPAPGIAALPSLLGIIQMIFFGLRGW